MNILIVIAVICALLFFGTVFRDLGAARPRARPVAVSALLSAACTRCWCSGSRSAERARQEAPYIGKNIEATRAAFGLEDTTVSDVRRQRRRSARQLKADAASMPGIRLWTRTCSPTPSSSSSRSAVSTAFPGARRRPLHDRRPVARRRGCGPRDPPRRPARRAKNWINDQTVYTHGYGLIAAYGNQRDEVGPGRTDGDRSAPRGPPAAPAPSTTQPARSYPRGSTSASTARRTRSSAGLGQGRRARRARGQWDGPVADQHLHRQGRRRDRQPLRQAALRGEVRRRQHPAVLAGQRDRKILYDRCRASGSQKAAPWLTLDPDPFPAVVDGRIVWILDGYTTNDRYPLPETSRCRR